MSKCRCSPIITATPCIFGNAIARVQRRHQKLIEESPGTSISPRNAQRDVRMRPCD